MRVHRFHQIYSGWSSLSWFKLFNLCTIIQLLLLDASLAENVVSNCDALQATGTSLLCTPPQGFGTISTDCSQPSVPGTIASYACRNSRGEVLGGFLNCTNEGYWISSMSSGNNSLCNLDAAIINIQSPDVAVVLGNPGFTTPLPDIQLLQKDFGILNDVQKVGLQLHNIFRRNHGISFVAMAPLLNDVAQELSDFIAFGNSSSDSNAGEKLSLINSTSNIEMNWYLQQPGSSNPIESVSNAVQSWYSTGFPEYDWVNVGNNLDKPEVISFSRVIWKSTKFIGMGVTNFNGVTFVCSIYTPGRHIGSTDPIQEFQSNVLPIKIIGSKK